MKEPTVLIRLTALEVALIKKEKEDSLSWLVDKILEQVDMTDAQADEILGECH